MEDKRNTRRRQLKIMNNLLKDARAHLLMPPYRPLSRGESRGEESSALTTRPPTGSASIPRGHFYFRLNSYYARLLGSASNALWPQRNRIVITLPRIRPEFCGGAMGRQLVRALEAHYGLGVAEGDEFVGPDTCVSLGVVYQTGIAVGLMRLAVNALHISGAAAVAVRVHAELIFATGAANRCVWGGTIVSKRNFRKFFYMALKSKLIFSLKRYTVMDHDTSVKMLWLRRWYYADVKLNIIGLNESKLSVSVFGYE